MANPIKETPILRGKDAANFIRETNSSTKISVNASVRIKENFNKLKTISKF